MKFGECLKSYGVTALWHMTHLSNLESILDKGLFCKNLANNQVVYRDISDSHVQSRRGEAHNYVPFYFADNTAMLYNVASLDCKVIMLQVSTEAADCEGVRFSDGNVAANATHVFDDPAKLADLDWNMIQASHRAIYGEWKRKRMAEVLIPESCASSNIRVIHVQNALADGGRVSDLVKTIANKFSNLQISVQENLTPKGIRS